MKRQSIAAHSDAAADSADWREAVGFQRFETPRALGDTVSCGTGQGIPEVTVFSAVPAHVILSLSRVKEALHPNWLRWL